MKRVIITILIFLFGIGCGFGAFFMLKTGGNMKKEELKSVQRLEVPKTETKASKEQKKKEEPKNSEQVKEKDDVPNFGTQEEETKAVEEICNSLDKKPSVVMICITCVDALLGTDMERVCRKAEEKTGLLVRPCYMYALTREGRKPPMVHVRQSIYSLLEPKKKKGNVVNLLGYFSPLVDDCELYELLHGAGVKTIHEISRCRDYAEYQTMSEANFNLVLHPEARFAAEDFHDRLKIPYIELRRLYQIDKIASQYRAFGAALGAEFDDEKPRRAAEDAVAKFRESHPDAAFAVGEWMNGDPFELALALVRYGFRVPEIYGTLSGENFVYVKQLAQISPETKVFSNLEPTMLYYDGSQSGVSLTIGKDAGYYHKECPNVLWNEERQPYGYAGVRRLFESLAEV